MAYRKRLLNQPQTEIPLEPLRGRQLMKRDRASSVHATGDRVLRHGRRILATVGLNGAEAWHVSDDAVSSEYSTHPLPNVDRVVMRLPAIPLTPGHFVRVSVVGNPSGKTQTAGYVDAGALGAVKVTATYNNGGAVNVTKTLGLTGSGETNAAQPQGAGAAWNQVQRRRSELFLPADMNSLANLAAWSDGVTVALTIAYVGSPRVIDLVVYEEPFALAYDLADSEWIAPLHADGSGGSLGQLPGTVPVIKHSASDPGHGAEIVADAARRQCQELGPVLMAWTAWDESVQPFDETETRERTTTSLSYVDLISGSTAVYDADGPGWSVSSGANARRVQESEASVVLRDATNAVPVYCYVYAKTSAPGTSGTVRFETGLESMVEVPIQSTVWTWHSQSGHLRCGLGAQDPTVLRVIGKTNNVGATLSYRYIVVVYADL